MLIRRLLTLLVSLGSCNVEEAGSRAADPVCSFSRPVRHGDGCNERRRERRRTRQPETNLVIPPRLPERQQYSHNEKNVTSLPECMHVCIPPLQPPSPIQYHNPLQPPLFSIHTPYLHSIIGRKQSTVQSSPCTPVTRSPIPKRGLFSRSGQVKD